MTARFALCKWGKKGYSQFHRGVKQKEETLFSRHPSAPTATTSTATGSITTSIRSLPMSWGKRRKGSKHADLRYCGLRRRPMKFPVLRQDFMWKWGTEWGTGKCCGVRLIGLCWPDLSDIHGAVEKAVYQLRWPEKRP